MLFVKLVPGTAQAIREFVEKQGIEGPLRINVGFAGCCDPSLGLMEDAVREADLVQEIEGLTFVMNPETYDLAGEVTISYVNDSANNGFVLASTKPVSEWAGFGVCSIKNRNDSQE